MCTLQKLHSTPAQILAETARWLDFALSCNTWCSYFPAHRDSDKSRECWNSNPEGSGCFQHTDLSRDQKLSAASDSKRPNTTLILVYELSSSSSLNKSEENESFDLLLPNFCMKHPVKVECMKSPFLTQTRGWKMVWIFSFQQQDVTFLLYFKMSKSDKEAEGSLKMLLLYLVCCGSAGFPFITNNEV